MELLVTLAVFAILASLAAPSFSSLVAENRLTSQSNELLGALIFARSEAIKSNESVTVTANNVGWTGGWDVRTASNNGLLRGYLPTSGSTNLICTNDCESVTFSGSGSAAQSAKFSLCHPSGTERQVVIELSGAASVMKNNNSCE